MPTRRFTFHTVELLGRTQHGIADQTQRQLLRLLTPLAKLWTRKLAVSITSETLESFGGAGYLEDTGLPQLLRDAQVLPIWEGTTNVQALDLLRALQGGSGIAPHPNAQRTLPAEADVPELAVAVHATREATTRLVDWLKRATADADLLEAGARDLATSLARIFAASLLLRHAAWSLRHERDPRAAAARCFVRHGLAHCGGEARKDARMLAADLHV